MALILGCLVACFLSFVIGYSFAHKDNRDREQEISARESRSRNEIKQQKAEIAIKRNEVAKEIVKERSELARYREAWKTEYNRLLNETKEVHLKFNEGYIQGRKWLANAFSEYIETRDMELECALVVKSKPAWKAAEVVASLRKKRVEMSRELKMLQYQIASYEEYFPFLQEYRDAILDELIDMRGGDIDALEEIDPALGLGYLTKEEYDKLSNTDKFQLALDRYWRKSKSNIEIGRVYERYIGYIYETEGWVVRFQGVLKGFEDFGRDLICTKNKETVIVQCKCWSKYKMIREKHVMQLYGTTILYRLTEKRKQINPVFVTTTDLSREAIMVAKELDVDVKRTELVRYPMIKCNINPGSGEKIYHLPFDQQYDRIIIGDQTGEFYADTVLQAEKAGFRRAHRWHGNAEGAE